jgi:hypothetical protein
MHPLRWMAPLWWLVMMGGAICVIWLIAAAR